MMLGKRGRAKNAMRRTTSMTEFAPPDVAAGGAAAAEEGEGRRQHEEQVARTEEAYGRVYGGAAAGGDWLAAYRVRTSPRAARAPGVSRRNSADFSALETAAFLRACGLCKRRLGPGRDTFMYKGETAFCSLECRQQHITQEEWKEKCTLTTLKEVAAPVSGGAENSGAGETVAAA